MTTSFSDIIISVEILQGFTAIIISKSRLQYYSNTRYYSRVLHELHYILYYVNCVVQELLQESCCMQQESHSAEGKTASSLILDSCAIWIGLLIVKSKANFSIYCTVIQFFLYFHPTTMCNKNAHKHNFFCEDMSLNWKLIFWRNFPFP